MKQHQKQNMTPETRHDIIRHDLVVEWYILFDIPQKCYT